MPLCPYKFFGMQPDSLSQTPEREEVIDMLVSQLAAEQRVVISAYLRADQGTKQSIYSRHQALLDWLGQSLWHQAGGNSQYYNQLWRGLSQNLNDNSDFEKTSPRSQPASHIQNLKPDTPEDLVRYLGEDERDMLRRRLEGQEPLSQELDFRVEQVGGFTIDNRMRLRKALGMPPPRELPGQPKTGLHQTDWAKAVPQKAPFSRRSPQAEPYVSAWADSRPPAASAEKIKAALPVGSLETRLYDYICPLSPQQWRAFAASFRGDSDTAQNLGIEAVSSDELIQAAQEVRRLQKEWNCNSDEMKVAFVRLQTCFRSLIG